MTRGRTAAALVVRSAGGALERGPDELIVEEPLEIRLDDHLVTTTMRTPGHDFELAVGFCLTDGLLAGAPVRQVRYCATGSAVATAFNVVSVETAGAPVPTPRLGTTTSSCGLCGSMSIDELGQRLAPLPPPGPLDLAVLGVAPDLMRAEQVLFTRTGAVHAAGAFDLGDGSPVLVREDVGRHNAVDKVVGRLALDERLPAARLGLAVSGRASFEIVQKAWAAGFAAVVAVSAPTSLAVETARAAGLVLVAFVRGDRLNVYAPERWPT